MRTIKIRLAKPEQHRRNINQLMQDQGLISLSTRGKDLGKQRFSRKQKHKSSSDCWSESLKKIDSSDLLTSEITGLSKESLVWEVSTYRLPH